MKTKHAFAVIAAACLSAAAMGPAKADAGAERRLGRLMALPVMAQVCHLTLTPEQIADVDKIGPKLQQDAGISDEQMKDVLQELAQGLKQDDCPGITAHWQDSVSALIAEAKSEQ